MADLPVSRLNRLARSFTIVAQILLAAIVLAWPARAASKDEYANVHTVAIVSTIGDTLVLKRVGLTAFGNSEEKRRSTGASTNFSPKTSAQHFRRASR